MIAAAHGESFPSSPVALHRWSDLLFVHYALPPQAVRVPPPLELQTYRDQAWLGVVAFWMPTVRPRWLPRICGLRFNELNVRTYVTFEGEPGVYFYSLSADAKLAVRWARRFWKLPYRDATIEYDRFGSHRRFCCRRADQTVWDVRFCVSDQVLAAPTGSMEAFLVERYRLFTLANGTLYTVCVRHVPYPLLAAEAEVLDDSLACADAAVRELGAASHVVFSPGVDVEVFALQRLTT